MVVVVVDVAVVEVIVVDTSVDPVMASALALREFCPEQPTRVARVITVNIGITAANGRRSRASSCTTAQD